MDARINSPAPWDDPLRLPGLSPAGATLLRRMVEHPCAPVYTNRSGHKLTPAWQAEARAFEQFSAQGPQSADSWLADWLADARSQVPAYGDYPDSDELTDLPTLCRADLNADVYRFVPDKLPASDLIAYTTSGSTGHPLTVPSHPLVAARYLALHRYALQRIAGINLHHGADRVGIVLAGYQSRCFTYVSVNPTLGESGLAKLNLHPCAWRDPAHRAPYLDALAPQIISGDPLSLPELMRLPLRHRPDALLSTSMTLSPALREQLTAHFACPVIDIYSMNETGPIAAFDPAIEAWRLLAPQQYIEILRANGSHAAEGEAGEITLTGGINFCLPLIRYRSGDWACWHTLPDGERVLRGLQGRPPVRFRRTDGSWLNNVDITQALFDLALPHYTLHQHADGALTFNLYASAAVQHAEAIRHRISTLLGQPITLDTPDLPSEGKLVQYTSSYPGATDAV